MNVNPMQLIQLIRNGQNPQQLLMSILANNNNPILSNAMQLMQSGNNKGLEILARNLATQRGIDFDQAYSEFKGYFK